MTPPQRRQSPCRPSQAAKSQTRPWLDCPPACTCAAKKSKEPESTRSYAPPMKFGYGRRSTRCQQIYVWLIVVSRPSSRRQPPSRCLCPPPKQTQATDRRLAESFKTCHLTCLSHARGPACAHTNASALARLTIAPVSVRTQTRPCSSGQAGPGWNRTRQPRRALPQRRCRARAWPHWCRCPHRYGPERRRRAAAAARRA